MSDGPTVIPDGGLYKPTGNPQTGQGADGVKRPTGLAWLGLVPIDTYTWKYLA